LGWAKTDLSIGVNTTDCSIPAADLLASVDRALILWNAIPESILRISRRDSTTDVSTFDNGMATDPPLIICDPNFGTTLGVNPDAIPGATLELAANPNLFYGGILLNSESGAAADISQLDQLSLDITIAHELGHVLGLGHSSQEQSLMYFSITGKTEVLISEDDKDGIVFLYPNNEFAKRPFGCSAIHAPGPVKASSMVWSLLVLLLFVIFNLRVGRIFRKEWVR